MAPYPVPNKTAKSRQGNLMNIVKVFVTVFFGAIGLIVLSVLASVGGLVGGGSSLIIQSIIGNVLVSSLVGGALSAFAFHLTVKSVDRFFVKVAAREASEKTEDDIDRDMVEIPPSLARDGKHFWGSLSFFLSTLLGVNLAAALFSDTTWSIVFTILGSGLLGLVGVGLVIWLKLWTPNLKSRKVWKGRLNR